MERKYVIINGIDTLLSIPFLMGNDPVRAVFQANGKGGGRAYARRAHIIWGGNGFFRPPYYRNAILPYKRMKRGTTGRFFRRCKRFLLAGGILSAALTAAGCGAVTTGVENLLTPPELDQEQAAISAALTARVGKDIRLQYPGGGDYRSAIIITDLDDEPGNEAVVFYQKTNALEESSRVRMNILDQQDGAWQSVYDYAGGGTEVDQVMLGEMGDLPGKVLAVGYSSQGQIDKNLRMYCYTGREIIPLYADVYALAELMDINDDGFNELVVVKGNISGMPGMITYYVRDEAGLVLTSQTEMNEAIVNYTEAVAGKVNETTSALFVDGMRSDGLLQTQVIYCWEGQLKNPLSAGVSELARTARPMGYASMDIDMDGIVEIPALSPFPGYETMEADERINAVEWYVFDRYALVRDNISWYSLADGFCFMLPSRWQGNVTARVDSVTEEIIFYKYDGTLENSTVELLRLCAVSRQNAGERIAQGYEEIKSNENIQYLAYIPPDSSEPLILTMTEISFNFYILQ